MVASTVPLILQGEKTLFYEYFGGAGVGGDSGCCDIRSSETIWPPKTLRAAVEGDSIQGRRWPSIFEFGACLWTPSQTFLRQTTEYVPLKVTDDGCVGGRRGSDIIIRSGELHVSFMSVLSFSRRCKGGLSVEPERVCGVREILARRVTRSTDYWRFD